MKKRVVLFFACLVLVVGLSDVSAQKKRLSDAALEEDFISSRAKIGESHASGNRPELGPVNLGTPTQVVQIIRVGLYANTFTAGGGISSEFASLHHEVVSLTNTEGVVSVIDLSTGNEITTMQPGQTFDVNFNGTQYVVSSGGSSQSVTGPVRFVPQSEANLFQIESILRSTLGVVNKPQYRGEIEISRGSSTTAERVNLVNIVEVEKYVRGVVANESIASFHMDALKAQAIAARGYSIANKGRYVGLGYPFDIVDSSASQVYRGYLTEHPRAVQATDESTGLVATYNGTIISALYSSSFGGYSDSNHWIFNVPSNQLPGTNVTNFLIGIFDGTGTAPDLTDPVAHEAFWKNIVPEGFDMCGRVNNRFARWKMTLPAADIKARLTGNRYVLISGDLTGTVIGVTPLLRMTGSNRIASARIDLTTGVAEVRGWDNMRNVLGRTVASEAAVCPNSTAIAANFTLTNPSIIEPYTDGGGSFAGVITYGGGWGHNVGMSQYGAHGRGSAGQNFIQILKSYYTGVDIGTYPISISSAPSAPVLSQVFYSPNATGRVVIRSSRLKSLAFRVNDTWLHTWLTGLDGSVRNVDISPYLVEGLNTVEFEGLGTRGTASIQVIVE
ncbi:MAG: SpoIID/LytB domain-containing protein [Acidobacteria bacterium]|nr:SpoIID/LytB domain-containing protein [Acidobacteriota bacterium]